MSRSAEQQRIDRLVAVSTIIGIIISGCLMIPAVMDGIQDPLVAAINSDSLMKRLGGIVVVMLSGILTIGFGSLFVCSAYVRRTPMVMPVLGACLLLAGQVAMMTMTSSVTRHGAPGTEHVAALIRGPSSAWRIGADPNGRIMLFERSNDAAITIGDQVIQMPDTRLITMDQRDLIAIADVLRQEPDVATRFASNTMIAGAKP